MERQEQRPSRALFGKTPVLGIVVMTVVVTGLVVDATKAEGDNFYADIIRLDNVATKIHQNYVEEMPSKDLIDNAIKGMMQILDPHTSYFESKEYEELRIHTEGKFGGLGIQISIRDKVLTVMTPIAGTPAYRAGIQSGDQIIKIDGKPTAGITIDNAVSKLRGEPGTGVTISIRRRGETKDIEYTITREVIHIKSVPYYGVIGNDIGYVQLTTFSQEAGAEVEKAIKELLKKDIKGLVFDLRHNPGGLLPQAIEVAEKFLPRKSLVVSTRGRVRGQNKEYYSAAQPALPVELPLAVLVDYASASASEIVAGAIQDWDRGIVVGDTTFGKGSVQSILPLDKTHHLKLTTAFYYTPSGRCINRPENAVRGTSSDSELDGEGVGDETLLDSLKTEKADTAAPVDTTQYKTKNGRLVYGGGGIIPDTIVDQPTLTMVMRSLLGKDVFFQFANLEYPRLKKRKVKIEREYQIDEKTLADFYGYLDSIKFTYQSLAQLRFDEFKRRAGILVDSLTDTMNVGLRTEIGELPSLDQGEKTAFVKASERIDSLLQQESRRAVEKHAQEVRKYLREALQVREFGQDHEVAYRTKLASDSQLKAALAILTSKNEYSVLLKPKMVGHAAGAGKQSAGKK